MTCSLWGHHINEFTSYVSTYDRPPTVVILQMCRAKIGESYRGNIVTIATSYNATRVETGVLVPQIQAYKDRLSSMEGELEELAAGNIDVRTLDYFVDGKMIGEHWVCAKVRNISQNWWYISCLKCPKKV
ncbi:inosine-5'-monophosphate dehydrogenase [Striga asiatica]|uniref:Inosine-5'-monophosphate dehydrogenase n=1 Tax=Striga asiatica TaxID=4170 RepID=A0A5A7Q3D9_STRAF|nr:inosine-5'-monophosphate dehydrogenase [Striga asiatica]